VLCTTPPFVVGKGSPGNAFRFIVPLKKGLEVRRITSSL